GAVARGPMLAEVLPITGATLVLGKWRQLFLTGLAGLMAFSVAYAVEPVFFDYAEASSSDERPISTRQIVDNVLSIAGQGGEQSEGTKEWRLEWWKMIIANTIFGPDFWTGRGFGLNIALADGFSNWTSRSLGPPLRSPHNVQMTILARAGVPGLTLWFGFIVSWLGMVMHAMRAARRRGHTEWAGLFLFLGCYVASIIINASFDPVLEGPMQGVWFWSLIGFGIGSTMVYRSRAMASPNLVANNPEP
ncbi:MAG TPA: O-antigen ligase family protein, partial [Stellaceae bacterium]|nr:O-antigen ligase family protein [Stellaceae bacterium]